MRQDYSRERNRWDKLSSRIPKPPSDYWDCMDNGYTPSGKVHPIAQAPVIDIPSDLGGLTGKQLAKALKKRRREERERAEQDLLDVGIDELVKHERYGGEGWGAF